ncbi:COG1470 family protein [Paludibaculum fermentans]|uniref:COG1470 family protein n=1 Tax=Paludibaculum fermentans TaxID=1473598 RepID=UPI003EBBA53F
MMPSSSKCIAYAFMLMLLSSFQVKAQALPAAPLRNAQIRKTIPAGTVHTIPLNLQPWAIHGGSILVIYTDPALAMSLILPDGTGLTPVNASSLGFRWEHPSRTRPDRDLSLPVAVQGEHILISLPTDAVPGTYTVRVDASAASSNASVLVQAIGNSGLAASLVATREWYLPEEPVLFTGMATEGTGILKSPTMALAVERTAPVGAGLSMTNVRFVRCEALAGGVYRHYFTGDLVSRDVTAKLVSAQAEGIAGTVHFSQDRLSFSSVQAGSTSTTPATLSVDTDSTDVPGSADWAWSFESTGYPVIVPMRNSGTGGAAAGDGLFTGVFSTVKTGRYSAYLTVSGVTPSGSQYTASASTSFRVEAEEGSILSCSDQPLDDDGNGSYDRLETTMLVYVSQAARYRVHLELRDPSGKSVSAETLANLTPGDQAVRLRHSALQLRRELASNGPYQRTITQLWLADRGHNELLSSTACGTTRAYRLTDFSPDRVRLANAGTLTPVDENGIAGFESLNYTQPVIAPAGKCHWSATLQSADGTRLDARHGSSIWPGGIATLAATFSGAKIHLSGKPGPYKVGSLRVTCADGELLQIAAAAAGPYSAADFEATPADFAISARGIAAQPGVQATSTVFTTALRDFDATIALSVTGVPPQWSATLKVPSVSAGAAANLDIMPANGAAEGIYPLTVTGVSGSLTHSTQIMVVIPANPVTVSIQPGYTVLHPGQKQLFSAQVPNEPDTPFEWKAPTIGTLTSGQYQAPSIISDRRRIHVTAASMSNSTKSARAYIELYPPALVTVSPTAATLSAGQTQKLVAEVQSVQEPSVQWTITPQLGTLTPTSVTRAVYTAPSTITTPQTITITATSVEDPSQSTSMTIALQP